MLKQLEAYRKSIVALVTGAAGYFYVLSSADFSTKEGIIAAVIAALGVAGVYGAKNEPLKPAKKK